MYADFKQLTHYSEIWASLITTERCSLADTKRMSVLTFWRKLTVSVILFFFSFCFCYLIKILTTYLFVCCQFQLVFLYEYATAWKNVIKRYSSTWIILQWVYFPDIMHPVNCKVIQNTLKGVKIKKKHTS